MTHTSDTTETEKIEVYYGQESAMKILLQAMANVKKDAIICSDAQSAAFSMTIEPVKRMFVDFRRKGVKIRSITEITNKNLQHCKQLMQYVELRHLEGIKGNFAVSEKEYVATAIVQEEQPVTQTIYSNAKSILDQHHYLFETLWSRAIPAQQRIREIEEGIPFQQIDVVQDPKQSLALYMDLVKSSKKEILLLFPTVNAVVRQTNAGIMCLIKEAALQHNVKVRILLPDHEITRSSVAQLMNDERSIIVRFVEHAHSGKATILIVDSKECLMMELKDDNKTTFYEAIGLSMYSNSRAGVLSYISMFESLWRQTELYQRLKEHDKIQREFINIAAHELRTPVQPLLGVADILMTEFEENKKRQKIEVTKADVEMIVRNAKRLERLTSDILEVSRLDSNTLKLNEEIIDLNEKIKNVVNDQRITIPEGRKLYIIFDQKESVPLLIRGDRLRLFRVLSNIIGNAIKFTDEGTIIVTAEKNDRNEAVVTIRDTGKGIDKEILPRLFTKFTSKSNFGTGLGLYLSKGIVEAHGGRIWAENNKGGKGAAFRFTLPLITLEKSSQNG